MTEPEIKDLLRAWIVNRAKSKPDSLTDDMPVLELGILSSLDIVELILHIERLRDGAEVEVDSLEPAAFRNINSMYSAFFAPASG
jgi:acyl carrier protein